MRLIELASDYVAEKEVSQGYEDQLFRAVRRLQDYVGRELSEFPLEKVNGFLKREVELTSRFNARTYRQRILTLWNYGADRGLWDYPKARRIRRFSLELPVPEAIPKEHIRALVDGAGALTGMYNEKTKRSDYWAAVIIGAFDLGFRRGDIWRVPRKIVDGQPFAFREHKEKRLQCRQLSTEGCDLLQKIHLGDYAYKFPFGETSWRKHWSEVVDASGLDIPYKFKQLRKSHGTYAKTLGHASNKVFEDFYFDPKLGLEPSGPGEL